MFLLRYSHHPSRRKSTHERDSEADMKAGDICDRPLRRNDTARDHTLAVTRPVTIPSRNSSRSKDCRPPIVRRSSASSRRTRQPSEHDKNALPSAVAALLAVTAIPVRKTNKRRSQQRRISIDQLVQQWRTEALSLPSYGSHRSLDILLDLTDESLETSVASLDTYAPSPPAAQRLDSSDSVPSLDAGDGGSLLSFEDPPTPGHTRQKRTSVSALKSKVRSASVSKDCALDHPLIQDELFDEDVADDEFELTLNLPASPSADSSSPADKPKASFKSNLTLSLQSLKSRALSSLSTFTLNSGSNLQPSSPQTYAFSDEQLWSHPYIFPRLTTEVRPSPFSSTPTESERRYLNPTPRHRPSSPPPSSPRFADGYPQLSLEEQRQHYRAALHTPERNMARGEAVVARSRSPMIQMVTYSRPSKTPAQSQTPSSKARRRSSSGRVQPPSSLGPTSQQQQPTPSSDFESSNPEAILGVVVAGRQREPRENSAFLRVVVLEMNMRRAGKLEDGVGGRARIWLPPRRCSPFNSAGDAASTSLQATTGGGLVPLRWAGVSAVDDD